MPIKTPNFGFYSFTTGDTYSSKIDKDRFQTIDNSFAFISEVIGDGIISGFEIIEDPEEASAIIVSPGIALIDKISSRVFVSKKINLPNNKTSYIYVRRRIDAIGEFSGFSDFYTIEFEDLDPPSVPINFSVGNIGDYFVSFSWESESETDLKNFEIHRKGASEDSFSLIGTVDYTELNFTDESVNQNSSYFYKVRSVDLSGNNSVFSEILEVQTGADLSQPQPPLDIQVYNAEKSAQIIWGAPVGDLISYIQIKYYAVGSDYSQIEEETIVNVDKNNLNYIFLNLSNSSNYRALIKSVSINGVGSVEIEKILEPRSHGLPYDVSFMYVDTIDWSNSTALNIVWNLFSGEVEVEDEGGLEGGGLLEDPYAEDPYAIQGQGAQFEPPIIPPADDDDEDIFTKIQITQINADGTKIESDLMQAYNPGTATFNEFNVTSDDGGGIPIPETFPILPKQLYLVSIYRYSNGALSIGRFVRIVTKDFTDPPIIENLNINVLQDTSIEMQWTNPDPSDVVDYDMLIYRSPVLAIDYSGDAINALTISNKEIDLDAYYLYRFEDSILYAELNPFYATGQVIGGIELFIPTFQIDANNMNIEELTSALTSIEIAPLINGILSDYVNVWTSSLTEGRSVSDIMTIPSFPNGEHATYQKLQVVPLPGQETNVDVDLGAPILVYDGTSGGIAYFKMTPDTIIPSSQYDFKIRSRDGSGNVSEYLTGSILVQSEEYFDKPGYPRNLYASPGDGFIILNWSPPVNDADLEFFSIYRLEAQNGVIAENFIKIDTVSSNTYQYIDYTVQNNITYVYLITSITYYGVESVNPIDDDKINAPLVYMTPRESGTLSSPFNLIVTVDGNNAVLEWESSQDSFDGFEIYRSFNSKVNFNLIETIPGSIRTYRDVGGLFQTGVYRYMVRKVVNEADVGFNEIYELPSFSEFIASVTVSDGDISINPNLKRDLQGLNTPITDITKEVTHAHRHYKISDSDDRRINVSEGITIDDWYTGPNDGRVWNTNIDLSIYDPNMEYQAYIDDELARMLYYLDFETGTLTFEETLAILQGGSEGGALQVVLDGSITFPEVKIVFATNEFEGDLSSSFVESVSATQFSKNQLVGDMIPDVQHSGRIKEDLIPLRVSMSTLDGYSYYGVRDEDGNEIDSNEEEAATPLKLWDTEASGDPPIIFYDLAYFPSEDINVMWAATSIGLIYSEDFGVTWDKDNRASVSTMLAPHRIFKSDIYNKVFMLTNRSVFVSPVPGSPLGGEEDGSVSPSGAFSEIEGIAASSVIRDIVEVESDQISVIETGLIIKKRPLYEVNLFEFQKIGSKFRWEGLLDWNYDLGREISINNLTLLELRTVIEESLVFITGDGNKVYMRDIYEIDLGSNIALPSSTLIDTDLIVDEEDIEFKAEVPYLDPRSGMFISTNLGLYRLRYDLYGVNPILTQRQIFGSSTTNAYAMLYDKINGRLLISTDTGLLETGDGAESFFLVEDIADQVPIYAFVKEGEYVFAIAEHHIYRRDPGRRDFIQIYYAEDFFMRKATLHYGRLYVTTSKGLMCTTYGDNIFASSSIDLNHASGALVKNGKDMAVHCARKISDKLFIGSESALFVSTSSSLVYKHWENPSASIPSIYVGDEEQKIGWYILNYALDSTGGIVGIVNTLTFDEKHDDSDHVSVARQYRRFRAKNGGWVDLDFSSAVLMYINGYRINDGSRSAKPVYAILDVLQKPVDITDTISHLKGAEKYLEQLRASGSILIANQIDSDGTVTELGYANFTRENVRILNNLIDKFNSQTYFTDPKNNEDITYKTKMSLPEFTVYLIGGDYNPNHTMEFLGYEDFGEYPVEEIVGGIITNDEEDREWLLPDPFVYGDGDGYMDDIPGGGGGSGGSGGGGGGMGGGGGGGT